LAKIVNISFSCLKAILTKNYQLVTLAGARVSNIHISCNKPSPIPPKL